jgi:hypothetical protein
MQYRFKDLAITLSDEHFKTGSIGKIPGGTRFECGDTGVCGATGTCGATGCGFTDGCGDTHCGPTGGDALAQWWTELSISAKAADLDGILRGPNRDALLQILHAEAALRNSPASRLGTRELQVLETRLHALLTEIRTQLAARGAR